MVKSMTGFGRGEAPYGDGSVVVEVTTVNGRHLDVNVRGLREYGALELQVRSRLAERLGRGSAHVAVAVRGAPPTTKRVTADVEFARAFANEFERLRFALGLKGQLPLEALTAREEFLVVEEEASDQEALARSLLAALDEALAGVVAMREAEGASLAADLAERSKRLGETIEQAAERAPAVAESYREKLRARAAELASLAAVEEARLEAEVALFAERSNIDEEIVRSRAHLAAFAEGLRAEGRVGRRLDFLLVELNREANTIASKAADAELAARAVEIKDLLEQMREQVQNLE
ncbi:MAG: YicC family protein [Candidatus Coatesbacteria bacterium]|nr:MAG: YicC family protein [Candidatus Coatesbacteria bacterium]